MRAARDSWLNPCAALLLCAIAGITFSWLRSPLPWMIGPLVSMAVFNFAGAELRAFRLARPAGQVIIGTALGLYFTPAVTREVASYWFLLVGAALFAIALAWGCSQVLVRVGGVDRVTAFFASVPGGAAEMAVLGERYGGRVDRIALAQSLRILVVVIVIPFAMLLADVHGAHAYVPGISTFRLEGFALLLAIGVAAGALLSSLRFANPFMFGPLLVSTVLTGHGLEFSSVPGEASNLGQLLLGCALGSRFERRYLQGLGRYMGAVVASIAFALAASLAFSAALAWLTRLPLPSLVLATAPGGISEMCITAKVLQLGVPLVTAAHVTRVLVLITATAPLYRLARAVSERRARRAGKSL